MSGVLDGRRRAVTETPDRAGRQGFDDTTTARPPDHDNEDQARRERALAAAVVLKAVEDSKSTADRDRHDAWSFLTDAHGGWKESRDEWCNLADVDPDVVREKALAGQFGPAPRPKPEQPKPARKLRKQLAPRPPSTAEIEEAVLIAVEDVDLDWKTCSSNEVVQAFEAASVKQWNGRPFNSSHVGRILQAERERVGLIKPKPPKPAPRPKPIVRRTFRIPAALLASASHAAFAVRF